MLGLTSRTPSDLNACKFTCTEKKTKTKTKNNELHQCVIPLPRFGIYEALEDFTGFWFRGEKSVILQLQNELDRDLFSLTAHMGKATAKHILGSWKPGKE